MRIEIVALNLLIGFSSLSIAAPPTIQGVIHFHGNIVETPCTQSIVNNEEPRTAQLSLEHCPAAVAARSTGTPWIAPQQKVEAISRSGAQIQLVANRKNNSDDNKQLFTLIDSTGRPANFGKYRVTLTYP
ncbi:type 1 fimbrial protein [Pseudomonas sp. MDT2-39-1]|uniref:type 1 fimbrial protein n=1 Tax=Pseudomonas sp. BGI-2 TaxID=2528211 RepID=UPI0010352369|nr:type 1 fimbrial protein [Pseudomonas sp. BGI-2]TBN40715.1 type 1 fimbrial protein [Pseudomonas sp. BGI-2]